MQWHVTTGRLDCVKSVLVLSNNAHICEVLPLDFITAF